MTTRPILRRIEELSPEGRTGTIIDIPYATMVKLFGEPETLDTDVNWGVVDEDGRKLWVWTHKSKRPESHSDWSMAGDFCLAAELFGYHCVSHWLDNISARLQLRQAPPPYGHYV